MVRPVLMLTTALLLAACTGCSLQASPGTSKVLDIRAIDRLAQARDVAGLQKLVVGEAPLSVLKTNGAYEGGKFGWNAVSATAPNGNRFVVLTTPLTSEDVGELLFLENDGKLQYIPETVTFGVRITREDLTAQFDLTKSTVKLVARVAIAAAPVPSTPPYVGPLKGSFIFRLGPNFKVSALALADGTAVPFVQAGGIVWVDSPIKDQTLVVTYAGVVNKPEYAGSIDAEHIQLSNEFWFPAIARLPVPYSLVAKIPDGWVAVGQGEAAPVGDDGKARFAMALPSSVWSFAAEPFKSYTRKAKSGLIYNVYSRSLSETQMKRQTELSEPILDFYSRHFGAYPFTQWGAADVKTYGSGALEAYSFATYGAGFLPDEDAHEPSHTWWGGILSNTYLHSFWNESFAVWSEGLYQRNVPIGNVEARREAFADLAEASPEYDRIPVASGSCFIGPEASSLGYGKGSHVLAMLEQLVGTDRMMEGCREWIKTHPKGEPAEWESFEATMIRLYPTLDLKSYFDDWLRKPGAAEVEIREMKWDGRDLLGTMTADPWRMPLEFFLVSNSGKLERRTFDTRNVAADGTFKIPSGIGKPARVLFDPYHRALRKGASAPPTGFFETTRGFKVYRDPATPGYLPMRGTKLDAVPADLNRTVLIGHPRTTPSMAPLLAKIGMTVAGDTLSWRGTSVDLRQAGAVALIDLDGGKRCAIVLGTGDSQPKLGRASIALFDPLGRFLNGITPLPQPKDGVFEIK